MEKLEIMKFIIEQPGLFIGLGFVIVATYLLPARVRWYVFTAGIAVVAFRTYQLAWAKKQLKKLDNERDSLKKQLQELREKSSELEKKHKELLSEKEGIENKRDDMKMKSRELDDKMSDLDANKEAQDADFDASKQRIADLNERAMAHMESYMAVIESVNRAEQLTAEIPESL